MERVAELSSSHKSSEPQLDAVGDAWSPGGAVGSELMPQVLGSAGWKGALWAPPPVAESPQAPAVGLEPVLLVTQGREFLLGTQDDNRLCKDALCPTLTWFKSSRTPAAMGV